MKYDDLLLRNYMPDSVTFCCGVRFQFDKKAYMAIFRNLISHNILAYRSSVFTNSWQLLKFDELENLLWKARKLALAIS